MIGWINKLFGRRTAVDQKRNNPVVQAAVKRSALVYQQIPLRHFIDDERQQRLARQLFLELSRICNTVDPVTCCREEFAAVMLRLSAYQVLVIPPEPEHDVSGLRAQPGVTGELKAHLVELCAIDDELRSAMYAETESEDHDDLWEVVQRRYWETYWLLETLNAARVELGDSIASNDWDRPFMHAACVDAEHRYRWQLDLPPAFDEDIAKEASTAYSVFTDIVLSGSADPAAEWRDYYGGRRIPMPDFGPPAT